MKNAIFYLLTATIMLSGACVKTDNPTLKVISYNVRLGVADDGDNNWELRKHATRTMIERENPDLLGIQEGVIFQVQYIEQSCPEYARLGVGRDDGVEGGEIMAIFYLRDRFDLIDSGTFWLSETPDSISRGWDAACNRTATWARLHDKQSGREICYVNTHLDHMGETARKESIKLLVSKLRELTPEGTALVLGGDFNSPTNNAIFYPLEALLASSRDSSPVTDDKDTFTDFGHSKTTQQLDHLFFANMKSVSFRTLDGDYGAPYISDHYPIEAVFEL